MPVKYQAEERVGVGVRGGAVEYICWPRHQEERVEAEGHVGQE